ncbi:odorant receptor 46a-like isoform X1 [Vespula maculifrons]|uniref:Odorant receptor 46a-like isoform X1 n=1 Tax=Vespula maculifrons TaxID=7453 RepID=A0ABD2BPA4_VESMC
MGKREGLKLLGLWEYQTSIKKFIYVCFINFMIVLGIIIHIYAFLLSDRKIQSIIEILETTLLVICFGSCYFNLLSHGTIMKKILYRIKCDWEDLMKKPELVILKKYAVISRLCTIVIAISFYLYSAFLILPSFLSIFQYIFGFINESELILPLCLHYFQTNQIHYYLGICIQYVVVVIVTTIGIANYSMFVATIQHACALFKIIEWKIDDRFKKQSHNFDFVNDNTDLVEENEWLVGIIKFYNNAIEFILQILSLDMNKFERITNISFVIGSMFIIYTCYYIGQRLIDHSDDTFKAFCQIPFYSISLKAQKMLLFLIMSSMRLCNLSVMGVKEISHDLFASMQDILFRVKCDWNDLANTPELMILKKYAGISRLCTIIIAVSFYVYTAFLILPSLFSITRYIFGVINEDELILPIPVDYLAKDQLHYYFGVCIQCVIIIVITTMGIANYTMYIAIIQHACALFQIIEWKIDDRFKKQSHNFDFVNDNTDLVEENEWLVGIIKFYNNAIEFVLSLDMNKLERITNISFVIGSIFVIYTCYYIGQRLIDHSDNVFKAFCQIPFHLISVKAQKMLLFLIMRSMKLCNISVMGIKEVSHDLLLGLWEYQISSKQLIYVCFINLILVGGLFENIYALATSERKIESIVEILETTLPIICFGSCYCNLLFNATIMKKILFRMKCDWDDLADKPELMILKKYADISRLCTIVIAISFYLYSAFLILPSFLSIFKYIFGFINESELILPLFLHYFQKNQMHYYLGICIQYVVVVIVTTIGIANYSMFVATIQHACGLFKIIEWRVNDRFQKYLHNFHFVNDNTDLVKENEWLVGIIKFYNNAIEFVSHFTSIFTDLIKSFYETIYLFEALVSSIIIMVLSFDLNRSERLTNISYVIASLLVIYTYYYLGQKLIDHSENVFTAFCQIPFYSISVKTQKMLLFLIMSSMRLCNLSVMGVKEISHDLFATVNGWGMVRIFNDVRQTLGVEVSRCWKVTTDRSMLLGEEDYIDNEYYVYNRLLFRLLGLWQYQTSFKQFIYVCFINFMITLGFYQQVHSLFVSERKIKTIAKILEITLPTLCFGFCYFNLLSNAEIMKKILFRIKCDWNDLANKPELKILKKYAHFSRICTIIIAICFYLYIIFLMFPSFLRNLRYIFGVAVRTELVLPLRIDYFMKNQNHYYLGLFLQYMIISILCMVGVANYSMFVAVTQHAYALFNIIEWRVHERFKKKPKNFYYANNKAELAEEKQWLIDIIKFYNTTVEFVSRIVFQMLSFKINKTEGLTNFCYIIASLFVIYVYFYLGQKLIDHNNDVFTSLCQIPFYSLSLQTQKMLLFLIMKSMRLCSLSMEGVKDVSHDMFASKVVAVGSMLLKDKDYIDNEYYAYNRRFFRVIGLWEYQTSLRKLVYVCIINFMIAIGLYQQIYTLLTSERNLKSIAKLLEITLPTLCFGSCYYNLLSNGAIMKKMLYRIKHDWDELANKPELIILKKYAYVSRLCTVTIAVCFYLYIAFLVFPSLLSNFRYIFGAIRETELVLPIAFNVKNQMRYYLELSLQCINISVLCTVGIANYSMFIAVIQHACALFNIIIWRVNEKFKKQSHNSYRPDKKVVLAEENEWIIGIIKFYNNAIEFVNLIKAFYETSHLFEVFLAMIFIMIDYFYVFQVLCFDLTNTEKLTNICYVVASLFVIYAYFHFGQKLIDNNVNVSQTFRQIPFYVLSLKTQKILLFLIMKSMRQCNLTVEGMQDISHYLFASIMRSSFSFAMIV